MSAIDPQLAELVGLMDKLERRRSIFQLEYYQPYPYQVAFHNAIGKGSRTPAMQRALMAANGVGKTRCGAMEVAIHATGKYPDWWRGHRFHVAPEIIVIGQSNESVRDILQKALLGDPTDESMLGTGSIPIDMIGKRRQKAGVPNAYDTVRVKHVSGRWSRISFRAYEQGFKKFMGLRFDIGWCDEEPPQEIWSQMLRGTTGRSKGIIFCTFTPEEGMTQVVTQFMEDLQIGQALVGATWEDAKHLTEDEKRQRLAAYPAHEREMRSKGTPLMGAGLVFPIMDERIAVDPIEIPRHWPQIVGMDFGIAHPFAAANIAFDRDADCVYVTAEYRESGQLPAVQSQAIKAWGAWKPVAWPHDGTQTEKGTGDELIKNYRNCSLNVLPWKATNPPGPGENEGEGGVSVEKPIQEMIERMETGRWRVFKTCTKWMQEKRMYHRDKQGRIVKEQDDLISASRYAYMMLRHARTAPVLPRRSSPRVVGLRNWNGNQALHG